MNVTRYMNLLVTFIQGMWVYFTNAIATAKSEAITEAGVLDAALETSLQGEIATAKQEAITEAEALDDALELSLNAKIDTAKQEAIDAAATAAGVLDAALETSLQGEIATAKQQAIDAAETAAGLLDDAVKTTLRSEIEASKQQAIDAAATANDSLETSLQGEIATAKQEAIDAAQTAVNASATQLTSDLQAYADQAEADANTYTDTQVQGLQTQIDTQTSLIDQLQVLAANGLQAILVTVSADGQDALDAIEGAIPTSSGQKVDGSYALVLNVTGADSYAFTRNTVTYDISSGDFVRVIVSGNAITEFEVSHDNDNVRIGELETTRATITYVDGLDAATNARIDSFPTVLDSAMTQIFAGNQDALNIWAGAMTQFP